MSSKSEQISIALNRNQFYLVRCRKATSALVLHSRNQALPIGTTITEIEGRKISEFTSTSLHDFQWNTTITTFIVEETTYIVEDEEFQNKRALEVQPTRNRKRNTVDTSVISTLAQYWNYDNPCAHCGFLFLLSMTRAEKAICCRFGAYSWRNPGSKFPRLELLPRQLRHLLLNRTNHFSKLSNRYNAIFCIGATSIGSKTGTYERRFGSHCVTINGRLYHYIPTADSSSMKHAINYLVFGGDQDRVNETMPEQLRSELIPHFVTLLLQMFQIDIENPYTSELRMIGDTLTTIERELAPHAATQINEKTSIFHVGAITSESADGAMRVSFSLKGQRQFSDGSSEDIEPILYPLFFPYGERGWGADLRNDIQLSEYLRSRILMPEIDPMAVTDQDPYPLLSNTNSTGRSLSTNRFQLASRLTQFYLVDNFSRMIDRQLAWHKRNQAFITGASHSHLNEVAPSEINEADDDYAEELTEEEQTARILNAIEVIDADALGDSDDDDDDDDDKERTYLSESITGSARHRRKLAMNALEIVNQCGKPTVFITCTCNPQWPEIVERLFDGQTAFDRVDVTCIVFHQRIKKLMSNLRDGVYFGGLKATYDIHVIEYQHRGLPHAHIVVQLEHSPSSPEAAVPWIDKHISTAVPIIDEHSTPRQKKLHGLVDKHMKHVCVTAVNGCLNDHGFCRRGYSNKEIRPQTYIDDKGFPVYKRVQEEDLTIVPHNQGLLLDWEGHCNVEYCGSSYTVLYLYKYLFKGNKKVEGEIKETDRDEISAYLRGRMLCSMDAMWRILGYQNYPRTCPSVKVIKVKQLGIAEAIFEKKMLNDLYVYFNRPTFHALDTFLQFFGKYTYKRENPGNSPFWIKGYVEDIAFYLVPRQHTKAKVIIRLESVPIRSGEKWYLRLLLLHNPFRSHLDMKTVEGVTYSTYQEAAIARNIVKDHNEAYMAMLEMIPFSTAYELRNLFVIMTLEHHPTLRLLSKTLIMNAMTADFLIQVGMTDAQAKLLFLQHVKKRLKRENKSMEQYGLPDVEITDVTETQLYRSKYNATAHGEILETLLTNTPNNEEQQQLYEIIVNAVQSGETKFIFLQGQGGSGKSTFAMKVLAYTRSIGKIALGCAATGLAAQVYGQGEFTTAHALFGIPVIENDDDFDSHTECIRSSIASGSERAELLANTSLIIWDEFLSNHKNALETAFNLTNGFQGKVLLCMGDCKQIAPVVKSRQAAFTILASMTKSKHWPNFTVFKFSRNMRLSALQEDITLLTPAQLEDHAVQKSFAESLLAIGNGTESIHNPSVELGDAHHLDPSVLPYANRIRLSLFASVYSYEEAISFVYPQGLDTPNLHKRAIMAATNDQVDNWNQQIQSLNPNDICHFFSTDSLADIDDSVGNLAALITPEILHRYDVPNVPSHKLSLKKGDICLIIRTLRGCGNKVALSTNTRVKIMEIKTKCIRVLTLTKVPCQVNIPRIIFKFRLTSNESYYMHRKQYPLRLAYAMTINKSQGQEFESAVLDLSRPPFTHGLLYVGASRVRHSNNIRVFNCNNTGDNPAPVVTNIVFKDLLTPFD